MTDPAPLADDDRLASLAKALGHPARVQIVRLLAARNACFVGDLAEELPLAQSTISEHLRILRDAEVVVSGTLEGRPCYCLGSASLDELRSGLEALAVQSCCAPPASRPVTM